MDHREVALPIGPQAFGSAAGADYELWKPIAWSFNAPVVSRDHAYWLRADHGTQTAGDNRTDKYYELDLVNHENIV
jgi:hypothetical protein